MTRSSVNNAAELRQMSNPIPISVNTWRDPSIQSIDDSTQFDPGIIDQCISQSLSPGSAAYSLSPTSYAYQSRNSPGGGSVSNNNNNNTRQNPGVLNLQPQQPIQPMGSQSTITLSDNIQSNNLIGQSFLGGSGSGTDQGIDFSSHDVDLESLLVNTTLSDNNCFTLSAPPSCGDPSSSNENSGMNVMHNNNINNNSSSETSLLTTNSSSMGSALSPSNSKMNQADEENVNNNINPIFVFNGNKTGPHIMLGNKETNSQSSKMIKSSSSGNGGRAIFINQRINKIDEEEDNYQPAIPASSSNQTIRSILEQQQQQQQQQNHQFSTSLPSSSSYLTNSNMKMNSSSFINYEFGSNNNNSSGNRKDDGIGSSRKDHHQVTVGLQRNDPVLTQFVLNQNSVNNSGNLIGNNSSIASGNNNIIPTSGSRVAGGFMPSAPGGNAGQQHHTTQQHHHLLINQLQSNSSQQQAQQMLSNNNGQHGQKIELNSNYFIYSANGSNAATAAGITILPATVQQQSNQSGFISQPYSSSLPANYSVNTGFDFKIKNEPQSVGGNGAGSHLGDIVEDDRFSRLQIHSPLMSGSGHHHFGDTPSASVSPNSGVPLDMFDLKRGSNQTTASMDSGLGSSGNAANNNASLINDLFIDMATTPSPNTTQNSNSNNDYNSIMDVNRIANDLKIESMGFQNQQQQQQMLQDENEFEDDDEYDDDDDEDEDDDEEEEDDDDDDDEEDENEEDEFASGQTSRQPMYVGSVGTGSLAYMMQQKQQQPINSRKHAKINNTVGATDVHHSSSTTLNQMAGSVGNKLFSNVQFTGFNNQPQQAQQQQQILAHQANAYRFNPGINIINQQQQHQSLMQPQSQLISTSLPPMSTIDSIMFIKSEQNTMGQQQQIQPQSGFLNLQPINFISQQPQQQQQQGKDHPNLNKLLSSGPMLNQKSGLNLLNNDLLQPQIAIKSEAMDLHYLQPQQQMGRPANSNSIKQSVAQKQPTPRKLSNSFKPKKPAQSAAQTTKKRQKKKQELFDDDISDSDDDSDENSDNDDYDSDEDMTGGVKAEPCDMDSDSQMTNTTTTNSVSQHHSASKRGRSAKQLNSGSIGSNLSYNSPFMNSESMFDLMMSSKSRDAYFWQYNTQSKGPKTKKVLTLRNKDPHLHRDFYDPVFQLQSLNSRAGGANTGAANKLRKGDGNDVTPNPEKLYNLGHQIRDFIQKSYQMNNACFGTNGTGPQQQILFSGGTTPINHTLSASLDNSQLLSTSFPTEKVNLKREKNKIASRACRLKKKAQHEANKIKLFGLNEEHKQLINCISSVRSLIKTRLHDSHSLPANKHMVDMMDEITKVKLRTKVAGNTDGYVHGLMLLIESARANRPTTGSRSSKPAPVDLTGFTAQFNQSSMGNSNTNLNANTAGATTTTTTGGGLSTSVSASASFDNSSQATTQSYLNYQAEDNQMEDLQFGGQTNMF